MITTCSTGNRYRPSAERNTVLEKPLLPLTHSTSFVIDITNRINHSCSDSVKTGNFSRLRIGPYLELSSLGWKAGKTAKLRRSSNYFTNCAFSPSCLLQKCTAIRKGVVILLFTKPIRYFQLFLSGTWGRRSLRGISSSGSVFISGSISSFYASRSASRKDSVGVYLLQ